MSLLATIKFASVVSEYLELKSAGVSHLLDDFGHAFGEFAGPALKATKSQVTGIAPTGLAARKMMSKAPRPSADALLAEALGPAAQKAIGGIRTQYPKRMEKLVA